MSLKRDILVGLGLLGLLLLIVTTLVGVVLLVKKALGLIVLLFGIFMLLWFPDVPDYQYEGFVKPGIWIGLAAVIVGIILLIF